MQRSLIEQILEKQPVADVTTKTPALRLVVNNAPTREETAPKPPSTKAIAQIIVIALLSFFLLMVLLGFAQVILRGPA